MSFWSNFYGVSSPPAKHLLSSIAGKSIFNSFYSQGQAMDWGGKRAAFSLSFDFDSRKDLKYLPAALEMLDSHSIRQVLHAWENLWKRAPGNTGRFWRMAMR